MYCFYCSVKKIDFFGFYAYVSIYLFFFFLSNEKIKGRDRMDVFVSDDWTVFFFLFCYWSKYDGTSDFVAPGF